MYKKIAICMCLLNLLVISPVFAAIPVDGEPNSPELKGAKQITPVLDMAGKEIKRVGTRLVDNAIYSMEHLWQDTINLNFKF